MESTMTAPKPPHCAALQAERLSEVRALSVSAWQELRVEFAQAWTLPKLDEHFRKHGQDFVEIGITTPAELNSLFIHHIRRSDLRIFTYIST